MHYYKHGEPCLGMLGQCMYLTNYDTIESYVTTVYIAYLNTKFIVNSLQLVY